MEYMLYGCKKADKTSDTESTSFGSYHVTYKEHIGRFHEQNYGSGVTNLIGSLPSADSIVLIEHRNNLKR